MLNLKKDVLATSRATLDAIDVATPKSINVGGTSIGFDDAYKTALRFASATLSK